ncbi:conserved oligomeric Golgi complex subunit 1 isoform X2 [Venturia canescens]|uniref:conserved oligomeric Golgi complex subunit 1 isoform X2 n=1 Tax=Venturia canescens TaxID=32260 RepID=UPI001C9C8E00|nr:conserved oligomeric Golgi complex subunit 1 isoform X2 [Venturia canescens]
MPGKQYVDLDINKLFEEHSIKEIEQIQRAIQLESDRKKIELRTLVGERYRDLIQAADTIAEMRETSKNVISRIADIEETFRDLQQKYLIGFKIDSSDNSSARDSDNISDSVVIQIKILMDIPEHIWSAIDNRDMLFASQLFILAQHVNYSLTFEIGQSVLAKNYPIVAKQWSIISHFRNVIFDQCNETLRSLDLSAEVAANCLAALVLLDGTSSKELLEKLISLRSQAIESIIKDENPHSVRHRIKLSVKLLSDTVILIHSCFIKMANLGQGLVSENIKKLRDVKASEMLYNLDLDNDLLEKFLPNVTKNHKPFSKEEFINVDRKEMSKILESWFSWIEKLGRTEISRLLNLVTSIRGVFNIREETLALESLENWNDITEELGLSRKNFWAVYYQPILTKRVKEIISEKWQESMNLLKSKLCQYLDEVSRSKCEFPENDLRWWVWKDSSSDIPQKLGKNMENKKKSLLMKSRGFSPNMVEVCENFDLSLEPLLKDLEQYLYESEKPRKSKDNLFSINLSSNFDKFGDRSEIQENLQNTSTTMIDELTKYFESSFLTKNPKFGRFEINVIVASRFFQAIVNLCPNLKKCFTLSKIPGLVTSNLKWQNICDHARDESSRFWSMYAHFFNEYISEHRLNFLTHSSDDRSHIYSLVSEWERVVIEEEAEEGKSIKSEIHVPYQPSVNLQKFLAAVSRDLTKIVPHTLPKKVMNEIIDNVASQLFDYYDEAAQNPNLRQKQAFQVLFDIKYVTLLMVPRENKNLMDRSIEVTNNVLAKIDPFDSDVFYPFIHINVKKGVQRSLLMFGNLVPHMEQLHSVLGSRSDYATSNGSRSMADPPGGLAICTGAPWFPPLAVTAPTRNLPLMPVSLPDKVQIAVFTSARKPQ